MSKLKTKIINFLKDNYQHLKRIQALENITEVYLNFKVKDYSKKNERQIMKTKPQQ